MAADKGSDKQDRRDRERSHDEATVPEEEGLGPEAGEEDSAGEEDRAVGDGTPDGDSRPGPAREGEEEDGEENGEPVEPDEAEAAGPPGDEDLPSGEELDEAAVDEEEAAAGHRPARSGAAAGAGAAHAERAASPPEDLSADSFGSWLRRQREMREIDLREIADQTKISLRYLKAMEQDRFDVLPAEVFARGFLREYARYVGLNQDEVVNYYLSSHKSPADGEEPAESGAMTTESRGPVSKRLMAALVLLLVLAVAAYLWFYQYSQEDGGETGDERSPMAASATDGPEPAPPEPSPEPTGTSPDGTPAAPLVVTLDFTQNCWVEARADDDRRVSRLFAAGESLQLEAREQVVLENLGNVEGVQVQVNGEPYDLPPAQGNSVRDVVIEAPEPAAPEEDGEGRRGGTGPTGGGTGAGEPGT